VFDDTGFEHLRVKVAVPNCPESAALLERLFENPDVFTTLKEAGLVDGRPFLDLEVFGVRSRVDEALGAARMNAVDIDAPREARV
jgi:hypothetical protein